MFEHHRGMIRYILGYHTVGTDAHIIADMNAADDLGTCPDQTVIPDDGSL